MRSDGTSAGASPSTAPAGGAKVAIPRGRPTPERLAAIEAAIRAAALETFLAVGFDAATMELVAQRAQVSKGTLYARYDSKEALFRAVIAAEVARWSDRAGARDHLLPAALGPRLRQHARVLAEIYDWPEYDRLSQLLEAALPTMPGLARDWEEMGSDRYIAFLVSDMSAAAPEADADWPFLAEMFLFAVSGWRRNAATRGKPAAGDVAAFADKVIDTIELAVSAAPRRAAG